MRTSRKFAKIYEAKINGRTYYTVKYYSLNDGKEIRKCKNFTDKLDAVKFQNDLNNELGIPEEYSINPSERILFAGVKDKMVRNNMPLSHLGLIIDDYVSRSFTERLLRNISIDSAIEMFIEECKNKSIKNLRRATWKYYHYYLASFRKKFDTLNLSAIEAETYIKSNTTPSHRLNVMKVFFNWCTEHRYILRNPFSDIKIKLPKKDHSIPDTLNIEEIKAILREVPEEWQPFFALLAFTGIRPNELISPYADKNTLKIGNIDFCNKKIKIDGSIAKTHQFRILENLPENLWTFLTPLQNKSLDMPVAPGSHSTYKRLRRSLSIKLPKDVFRHSFASYGYHYMGIERTIEIMGHVSGYRVFAKHYKGISNKQDSEAYFSITKASIKSFKHASEMKILKSD